MATTRQDESQNIMALIASLPQKHSMVILLVEQDMQVVFKLMRSIMGLKPMQVGSINFDGQRLQQFRPDQIVRLGVAVVPKGRQVFSNLSLPEHLTAFQRQRQAGAPTWGPETVYQLFFASG